MKEMQPDEEEREPAPDQEIFEDDADREGLLWDGELPFDPEDE